MDNQLGDYPKPTLWRSLGPRQVFMTSLLTEVLGEGPAVTVAGDVPDLHHFRGSFSGKHVIPLYRDADGLEPNVTAGLLGALGAAYGGPVSPEDLFAYTVALLSSRRYVERFSEELTIPGPRLPLTRDAALFREAAGLGRRLVNLHTRGERLPEGGGGAPPGAARNTVAVPGGPEGHPEQFFYNPATRTLRVGGGEFAPVPPEVWGFSVSGLEVVRSWLGYRMRERAGRKSSPLDEVRPEGWGVELTTELLELLWLLEATLALGPELDGVLEAVLSGEIFGAADLPRPSPAERRPPGGEEEEGEAAQAPLGL